MLADLQHVSDDSDLLGHQWGRANVIRMPIKTKLTGMLSADRTAVLPMSDVWGTGTDCGRKIGCLAPPRELRRDEGNCRSPQTPASAQAARHHCTTQQPPRRAASLASIASTKAAILALFKRRTTCGEHRVSCPSCHPSTQAPKSHPVSWSFTAAAQSRVVKRTISASGTSNDVSGLRRLHDAPGRVCVPGQQSYEKACARAQR